MPPITTQRICTQCGKSFSASRGGSFCDRCYAIRASENRRRRYMGLPPLPQVRYSGGEIEPQPGMHPAKPITRGISPSGARGVWRVEGPHWGADSRLQAAELRCLEQTGGLEPGDRAIAPDGKVYVFKAGGLMPERETI